MLALLATNRILFRLIPNSLALVHPVSNFSIFYISRSNSPAPMQTLNFSFIWASQIEELQQGSGTNLREMAIEMICYVFCII